MTQSTRRCNDNDSDSQQLKPEKASNQASPKRNYQSTLHNDISDDNICKEKSNPNQF